MSNSFSFSLHRFCRRNRFFGKVLGFHHYMEIVLSDFLLEDVQCIVQFLRIFIPAENGGNMLEITNFVDFDWIFQYISLFFHTTMLLIAVPTLKHGLIFNNTETDFCSRDFKKSPEQSIFADKFCSSILLFVRLSRRSQSNYSKSNRIEKKCKFDHYSINFD